jgi:hypothetical protein
MNSIAELQRKRIVEKINDDIRKYGAHMNEYVNEPMFPEKQISDAINYLRGEGRIKDFDVTCSEENITNDGILNANLEITLKPETIIQDFK